MNAKPVSACVPAPSRIAMGTIRVEHEHSSYAQVAKVSSMTGTSEVFVVVRPKPATSFAEQLESVFGNYEDVAAQLGLTGDSEVFRRVFLSDAANQSSSYAQSAHAGALTGASPIATSLIEEPPLCGAKLVLMAYHQLGAIEKTAVPLAGRALANGVVVRHGAYADVWLANLQDPLAACAHAFADAQTRMAFGAIKSVLAERGGTLLDSLIRTWVFVRDIDNHYLRMVAARRDLFRDEGLTAATRFVASTGIQGATHVPGTLVSLDALAVIGLQREQIIRVEARDHLNPTSEYNVTFERGTKVAYDDRSHVFISGTASIDARGQIVNVGDVGKQTRRTLENIECLLSNAGCGFADVTMMIVYLRDAVDAAQVEAHLAECVPSGVPRVLVHAPVCRPGWLVEIECMAARPALRPELPSYG